MKVFFTKAYWNELIASLLENLGHYEEILGQLIMAFIILTIFWLAAKLVQIIIKFILRLFHFDKFSDKVGFTRFLEHSGLHNIPSTTMSSLFYWIIIFIGFTQAVEVFGVVAFVLVQRLITYIPNALAAFLVLIMGMAVAVLLSKFLQSVIMRTGIRKGIAALLKNVLFAAIAVFSILLSLNQLNVPNEVTRTIITYLLHWGIIGFAIAFGLGGRHIASDIVASFKLKHLYPKGTEVSYDNVKGVLKEIGLYDSLVYTEKGIVNIPNSSLARKIIKRKI